MQAHSTEHHFKPTVAKSTGILDSSVGMAPDSVVDLAGAVNTGSFRTIRPAMFADEKVELCESRIMKPVKTHTNPNLF